MGIVAEDLRNPKPKEERSLLDVERELASQKDPGLPGGPGMMPEGLEALLSGGLSGGVDMAMSTPDLINKIVQGQKNLQVDLGGGLANNVLGMLGAQPVDLERFKVPGEVYEGTPIKDMAPFSPEQASGALSALTSPASTVEEGMDRMSALEERNPGYFGTGNFGSDLVALFSGRKAARAATETRVGGVFDKAIDDFVSKLGPKGADLDGVALTSKQVLESDLFRHIARGSGRAFETGLEAEFLNMLQGGDPGEAFGAAMGLQLMSSAALTTGAGVSELPVKLGVMQKDVSKLAKLSVGVGVQAWMMGNILKLVGDNPDAAEETAYDKAMLGMLLAAGLGLPGKRTKPDGLLAAFPNAADTVLLVPRTAAINFLSAMREGSEETRQVNDAIASDPTKFQDADLERWQGVMMDGGKEADAVGRELYRKYFGDQASDTPVNLLLVPEKGQKQALKPAYPPIFGEF